MSQPTSREEQRDRLLEAALVHVPFEGWSRRSLLAGAADLGLEPGLARRLFPRAGDDLLVQVERWADRQMLARAGAARGSARARSDRAPGPRAPGGAGPAPRGDAPGDRGPDAPEQRLRRLRQPVAHGRSDVVRRRRRAPATPATTPSARCSPRSGPAPSCSGSTTAPTGLRGHLGVPRSAHRQRHADRQLRARFDDFFQGSRPLNPMAQRR